VILFVVGKSCLRLLDLLVLFLWLALSFNR